MRVKLPSNIYTQINTNEDAFLIQNLSSYDLHIIVSATQPTTTTPYDFCIRPDNAIGDVHTKGICWGKPEGQIEISVGLVEE